MQHGAQSGQRAAALRPGAGRRSIRHLPAAGCPHTPPDGRGASLPLRRPCFNIGRPPGLGAQKHAARQRGRGAGAAGFFRQGARRSPGLRGMLSSCRRSLWGLQGGGERVGAAVRAVGWRRRGVSWGGCRCRSASEGLVWSWPCACIKRGAPIKCAGHAPRLQSTYARGTGGAALALATAFPQSVAGLLQCSSWPTAWRPGRACRRPGCTARALNSLHSPGCDGSPFSSWQAAGELQCSAPAPWNARRCPPHWAAAARLRRTHAWVGPQCCPAPRSWTHPAGCSASSRGSTGGMRGQPRDQCRPAPADLWASMRPPPLRCGSRFQQLPASIADTSTAQLRTAAKPRRRRDARGGQHSGTGCLGPSRWPGPRTMQPAGGCCGAGLRWALPLRLLCCDAPFLHTPIAHSLPPRCRRPCCLRLRVALGSGAHLSSI